MSQVASKEGFTLVEMLVVLAIMAVTLVVSYPYMRGSGEARVLGATVQALASRLREAQSTALFNNAERTLSIDLKHHLILDPVFAIPQGISMKITTANSEVTNELASIKFFADGRSTGGTITLSKGPNAQEISINWLTGAIVVAKAYPL